MLTFYTYTAITIALLWYTALERYSPYGFWRRLIPSIAIGALWLPIVLALVFLERDR